MRNFYPHTAVLLILACSGYTLWKVYSDNS